MRTAIYARVSTKDGSQDVQNQIDQLLRFAQSQNWHVETIYTDQASGSKSDRDAFQKMFAAASRREFDVLLFWSLDRLSREGVVQTLNYLERLTSYGIHYRSFTEQYLDSTGIFKEAVIGILAAIAKQERVRIRERTMAGLERARAKGKTLGRPRFSDEYPKKALQIIRLREQGKSLRQIAKAMEMAVGTVVNVLKEQEKAA